MGRKQTEATKQKIRDSWKASHPPVSGETRKKIGDSQRGRKRSEEFCLKNGERTKGKQYALGTKRTPEQRRKISEGNLGKVLSYETRTKLKEAWGRGRDKRCGENAGAWKGGVTPANILARNSTESDQWRMSVFERDNWTCQECGKRGNGELHAHHIKTFSDHPEKRFDLTNGITLCKPCHRKFHKIIPLPRRQYASQSAWMGA